MKKETTTVTTVTKIVYVSDDSKEFDTSSECLAHEKKLHHAEELFKKMPYFRLTPEFIPNDVALSWYYVSDDDDISAIELAEGVENIRSQLNDRQKPISYPCWICVCFYNEGYDPEFLWTADEYLAKLDEHMVELTKRMKERKHEE